MENLTDAASCQKMSLVEAISHLMTTGALSDVTFVVGKSPKQKTFQCHRLIFAARSDVFLAMFYGALREKQRVEIIDMEPDTFETMMRYIYTDKMVLRNMDETIKTYFAANKYNLVELMEMCYKHIEKNLNASNVCQVYELAFYMEKQALIIECDKIIKINSTDVLNSKGFARATAAVVKKILQEEGFTERKELFFFQSVLKWAEEECGRQQLKVTPVHMREVINPVLPHIRFLDMTHEDFVKGPATSKILESEEILSISMNIGVPGCTELPSWCKDTKNIKSLIKKGATLVLKISK